MTTKIIVPDSTRTYDCQVPGCDEKFLDRRKYERHVTSCVRKHRESLITLSEERQAAIDADPFQRVWDPEALEWVQKRHASGLKIS
jgi:hypothetical protein